MRSWGQKKGEQPVLYLYHAQKEKKGKEKKERAVGHQRLDPGRKKEQQARPGAVVRVFGKKRRLAPV